MPDQRPSVLHVLPHTGGGGERYVDSLSRMSGYQFERVYLARSRQRLTAIPRVISSVPRANRRGRHIDIVHVHGEIPSLLCLPAIAHRPSVVTLHGLNFVRRSTGVRARVAAANLRLIVRAAARVVCVTEAEREEVLNVVGTAADPKIEVVPLGVNAHEPSSQEQRAADRSTLGISGEFAVATVGALEYPKDPVTAARAAIEASRSGVPITLLVVGEGGLRQQLEDVASGSEGAVRLLGHRTDVMTVLSAADAFLLSSLHEGLPYALLEAMAAGLPVVVTDYPGASEAVGDAGLVVPRSDVPSLAGVLRSLADHSSERALLGERARARAAQVFSLGTMIGRTRRIYDELLEAA